MFTILTLILVVVLLLQVIKLRQEVQQIDIPDCRKCRREFKKTGG